MLKITILVKEKKSAIFYELEKRYFYVLSLSQKILSSAPFDTTK